MKCVALFDLDGTLTWRDTLVPFLGRYVLAHPWRVLRVGRLVPELARYLVGSSDRGRLKGAAIAAIMGGDSRPTVEAWADDFVAHLRAWGTFRSAALSVVEAHRAAGDHLVLLSASPDLYVPRIGRLLGFDRVICTEVEWRADRLIGRLVSANRRGEEKARCLAALRADYPNLAVAAYGNSDADLPHMKLADRATLVNGNSRARREAAALGIPTDEWR